MPTTKTAPAKSAQKAAPKSARSGKSAIDRTTELSEQVLQQVEEGQRSAIDAVRRFVGSVDGARPAAGDGSSKPQEIIDSALEMSDRLVQAQYDFLRGVVRSAGGALSGSDGKS